MTHTTRPSRAWKRRDISVVILGWLLMLGAMNAQASPSQDCITPQVSLNALMEKAWPSSVLDPLLRPKEMAPLSCLAKTTQEEIASKSAAAERASPEIFKFSYTLSNLIQLQAGMMDDSLPQDSEFILKISEGVEVLARHLDWRSKLVKMLLDSQDQPYPLELLDTSREELVLRMGDVASLGAKVDFMTNLMQHLVQSLMNSEIPLPTSQDEITLVFNVAGGLAAVDVLTVLQGSALDSSSVTAGPLDISQITVKISNGTITSEADLNPADFQITRGQLEIKFRLGPNSITSTAMFTKGEGGERQALVITAQVGAFNLTGQATFGLGASPEFKLEASLAGLLSFSALLTPAGFSQPTFGVEIKF